MQQQKDDENKDRLYVDLGCSFTHFLTEGRYFDQEDAFIPSKSYARFAFMPSASLFYPETAITTRYIHTQINRVRTPVTCVKWSPEGRRLITAAQNGEFTLCSSFGFVADSNITGHDSAIRTMVWSHDHELMISGDQDGKVKIWTPQIKPLRVLNAHQGQARGAAFAPTDVKFCTGGDDSEIKIWSLDCDEPDHVLKGHLFDVRAVDWHPEKSLVVSGGRDNLVKLWDPSKPNSKEIVTLSGHKNTVNVVAFSPLNGNLILSGSRDKTLRIYDIRRLRSNEECFLFQLDEHSSEIQDAKWHPVHENVFASAGYDGSLAFWSLNGAKVAPSLDAVIPAAHESSIWSLDWHPLGHLLATGSNDRTSKYWSRMLPGSNSEEDFYVGYTAKGSEVDLLKRVHALPDLNDVSSEQKEDSNYKDYIQNKVKNLKKRRLEVLGKVCIPGIGVVGEDAARNQAGLVLQPIHVSISEGAIYIADPAVASQAINLEYFDHKTPEKIDFHQLLASTVEAAESQGVNIQTQGALITSKTDASEIRLEQTRTDPTNLPGPRITGWIRMFDDKKGFGFIRAHDSSYQDFFARSADVEPGCGHPGELKLAKNDIVVFKPERGENKITGTEQFKAKSIVLIEFDPSRADDIPTDPFQQYIPGQNESKNMKEAGFTDPGRSGSNRDHARSTNRGRGNYEQRETVRFDARQSSMGQQRQIVTPEVIHLLLQNQNNPAQLAQIIDQYDIDITELQVLLASNFRQ